jgi:hypothetical protein
MMPAGADFHSVREEGARVAVEEHPVLRTYASLCRILARSMVRPGQTSSTVPYCDRSPLAPSADAAGHLHSSWAASACDTQRPSAPQWSPLSISGTGQASRWTSCVRPIRTHCTWTPSSSRRRHKEATVVSATIIAPPRYANMVSGPAPQLLNVDIRHHMSGLRLKDDWPERLRSNPHVDAGGCLVHRGP